MWNLPFTFVMAFSVLLMRTTIEWYVVHTLHTRVPQAP